MIAYNKTWLDNLEVHNMLQEANNAGSINSEEKKSAEAAFPVGFYSPDLFIRAGLFILTIIVAGFSLGLLCLMLLAGIEHAITGLLIFFAVLSYAALEFFVQKSNHYRSGVDDGLLWISGISLLTAINIDHNISFSANAIVVFILAGYFALRFLEMLMTAIAVLAFLAIIFLNYSGIGAIAKATTPFLLMLVAAVIYIVAKKTMNRNEYRHYLNCNIIIQVVSLGCFYAAANYFMVREVSNEMFGLNLQPGQSIPFGWLFWIFTFAIPVLYILRGLQKKDAVILRAGMVLVAAMVFTVRYYHSVWPLEMVMLTGGTLLVLLAYSVTRWLAEPKMGFTSAELKDRFLLDKMNVEALVIAETFGTAGAEENKFGGGSFGGGGSSGDF